MHLFWTGWEGGTGWKRDRAGVGLVVAWGDAYTGLWAYLGKGMNVVFSWDASSSCLATAAPSALRPRIRLPSKRDKLPTAWEDQCSQDSNQRGLGKKILHMPEITHWQLSKAHPLNHIKISQLPSYVQFSSGEVAFNEPQVHLHLCWIVAIGCT